MVELAASGDAAAAAGEAAVPVPGPREAVQCRIRPVARSSCGRAQPGAVGEVVTAAMGAYIVWEARNLGLPKWKIARMGGNVLFDTAIGAIPLIGDAADLLFRSNTKNLKILLKHLDTHRPESRLIEG